MRIVDTVYLVAYLVPDDQLHEEAARILEKGLGEDTRVSEAALVELDLIMKSRGYSVEERMKTWLYLAAVIGTAVEPLMPGDYAVAAQLEEQGLDYFDALIAAQCINRGAEPLTTDEKIVEAVRRVREGGSSTSSQRPP